MLLHNAYCDRTLICVTGIQYLVSISYAVLAFLSSLCWLVLSEPLLLSVLEIDLCCIYDLQRMMWCLWSGLHLCCMQSVLLIKELFSLSDNSSHILLDIVQSLDSFTLSNHLFVNNRLLTFYVTVSAVLSVSSKSLM